MKTDGKRTHLSTWKAIFLDHENESTRKERLRTGLLLVLFFCLADSVISGLGVYKRYDVFDLDKLAYHSQTKPDPAAGVPAAVILIGDDDYKKYSPDNGPLHAMPVLHTVQSICAMHPLRVGVDLFTADWPPATDQESHDSSQTNPLDGTEEQRKGILASLKDCHVVWIRDGEPMEAAAPEQQAAFTLGGVLGSKSLPEDGACTALPTFEPDFDGAIRRFSLAVLAGSSPQDIRPYVTMASALQIPRDSTRCGFVQSPSSEAEKLITIGYNQNSNIMRLPASTFFFEGDEATRQDFNNKIADKGGALGIGPNTIVILGGAYRYGRDRYNTPLGELYGAEILANAAVGKPITQFNPWLAALADFIVSAFILLIVSAFSLRFVWRTVLSILLGGMSAFFLAWWLFALNGTFYGVIAAVAGAFLAVAGELVLKECGKDLTSLGHYLQGKQPSHKKA